MKRRCHPQGFHLWLLAGIDGARDQGFATRKCLRHLVPDIIRPCNHGLAALQMTGRSLWVNQQRGAMRELPGMDVLAWHDARCVGSCVVSRPLVTTPGAACNLAGRGAGHVACHFGRHVGHIAWALSWSYFLLARALRRRDP